MDFKNLCRCCMLDSPNMKPLFGSSLEIMLKTFANIQIDKNDKLPQFVCIQCILLISRGFTFKNMVSYIITSCGWWLRMIGLSSISRLFYALPKQVITSITLQVEKTDAELRSRLRVVEDNVPPILSIDEEDLLADNDFIVLDAESGKELQNECLFFDSVDEIAAASIEEEDVIKVAEMMDFSEIVESCEDVVCFQCKMTYKTTEELVNHQKKAHELNANNRFECDVCGKTFPGDKAIKRHLKTHFAIKPYSCEICQHSFSEKSNLLKHFQKHTGAMRRSGKAYLCSICGKRFKWNSSLSKHMKLHTLTNLKHCPYCEKTYTEEKALTIHIRMHTGEPLPFKCDFCSRRFNQKANLLRHVRVHTGERPFLCPVCGKSFSQSSYVTLHLRTHTKEKPYRCDICQKSFALSNTLMNHKKIHSKERPYPCEICHKAFARSEGLKLHKRSSCHNGEKPYTCDKCSRRFSTSSHLNNHLRCHTNDKLSECLVCNKSFASPSTLKVGFDRYWSNLN